MLQEALSAKQILPSPNIERRNSGRDDTYSTFTAAAINDHLKHRDNTEGYLLFTARATKATSGSLVFQLGPQHRRRDNIFSASDDFRAIHDSADQETRRATKAVPRRIQRLGECDLRLGSTDSMFSNSDRGSCGAAQRQRLCNYANILTELNEEIPQQTESSTDGLAIDSTTSSPTYFMITASAELNSNKFKLNPAFTL